MPKKGYKFTEEARKKMSKSHVGYVMPEEQKLKISLANKGGNCGSFKKGNKGFWLGKKRSEDIIDKISKAKKGQPTWNKGIKLSIKHIKNLSESHKGLSQPKEEKSPKWKGNEVGYSGLHTWIRNKLGYPIKCEHCGKEGRKNSRRWNIEWANIGHVYQRNVFNWIGLCSSCHKKFDLNIFN